MVKIPVLVCTLFWGIHLSSKTTGLDVVDTDVFNQFIPSYQNHLFHTFPAILTIIEVCLVPYDPQSPGKRKACCFIFVGVYMCLVKEIFKMSGKWVYPILDIFYNTKYGLGFYAFGFAIAVLARKLSDLAQKLNNDDKIKNE